MYTSGNRSVKAIIYREDGKLLMQLRDLAKDIPFPGFWNFFGGTLEDGEDLIGALERELQEELGCVPGTIEEQLFQWEWKSDWASTMNYFFPVKWDENQEQLILLEGEKMEWLSLEDMVELPLTAGVYENFSKLAVFLEKFRSGQVDKIENRILAFNDLSKKTNRVFYVKQNPAGLSRQQIFLLKELAVLNDVAVFRVCLHVNDDCDIHEMMMIHVKPTSVGPLKQDKTSLSYHMLEGSLKICMHSEAGEVLKEYELNKNRSQWLSIRLDANKFRSVHTSSPFAVFIEVASGPFVDNDTIWLNGRSI